MNYFKTSTLCGNFWLGFYESTSLFDLWYKDELITKNVSAFSVFEEKIMAIKIFDYLYVYLINKNGLTAEDAITLIRVEDEYEGYEVIKFRVNDYIYTANFNCKITCCGRQ